MAFNEYVFLIAWNAIFVVVSLPGPLLAWRTKWQWKGQKDMFRTRILFVAAVSFFLQYLFQLAYYAKVYGIYKSDVDHNSYKSEAALDVIAMFFALVALLSIAALIFRTAISLLYNMSNDQKVGLARIVELAGFTGLAALVILAVVVWCIYVWYSANTVKFYNAIYYSEHQVETPFYTYEKISVAYEWIYFAFASIFLPIAFLQVLGRRTDRIAMLLFTFAILLIDALHVIEVVQGLVSIHKRNFLTGGTSSFDLGLEVAVVICESLFYIGAMYCLAIMGMRDPKRLTGEDEPVFTPVQQQFPNETTKYDAGALTHEEKGPVELPDDPAANGLLSKGDEAQELPASGIEELPGDAEVQKPQSKIGRLLKR